MNSVIYGTMDLVLVSKNDILPFVTICIDMEIIKWNIPTIKIVKITFVLSTYNSQLTEAENLMMIDMYESLKTEDYGKAQYFSSGDLLVTMVNVI